MRSTAKRNPATRLEDKANLDAERERAWREAAPNRAKFGEMVAMRRAEMRLNDYEPRTPGDILVLLGSERRSVRVSSAVAANPNTSAEALA